MPQAADRAPLLMVSVDQQSPVPMHHQIYDQIRDTILGGRLSPG